jgi:uncharacterized membrane protein
MDIYKTILLVHVILGTIGLLLGIVILAKRKGDKTHKKLGRIFAVAMLSSAFLSFFLSTMHPNIFLFCIGILTVHLVGTGWRYLFLKNLDNGQQPQFIDWFLFGFMIVFTLIFLYLGINTLLHNNMFGIAPLAFALLGFKNVYYDYKIYFGKITIKNYWLTTHLERMSGAIIASFTAFFVNAVGKYLGQFDFMENFSFITWILTGIIIIPFIIKWKRKYAIVEPLNLE